MFDEGSTVVYKNPFFKENERENEGGVAHLIQIKGNDIGCSYVIEDDVLIIGRSVESDVVLFSDSVSRKHLAIIKNGKNQYLIKDNRSTNGVYVNGQRVIETFLKDSDVINVGEFGFKFLDEFNNEAQYHEELYNLKNFDALTQVYNKRYFNNRLDYEYERVMRYNKELSYVIMDIDFFKKVNDTYGHIAGDYVLKQFASLLKSAIRKTDIIGRVGGEEFALIIPETPKMGAVILSEKLRTIIEKHDFEFKGRHIPVTVSMGVVSISNIEEGSDLIDLLEKADVLLYQAKKNGRNQVRYI